MSTSVPILIRDDVAWLPIPLDRLDYLERNSREALGWMLQGFIARARRQSGPDESVTEP